MDVYKYAQVIRGVVKLHGSWVLGDKNAISNILLLLGYMNNTFSKILDLSYGLNIVDEIIKSDNADWENILEYWTNYLIENLKISKDTAQQICVLWLASLRKLPPYVMQKDTDRDILHVWAETPDGWSGANLDNAINVADMKDVILLEKGNYHLQDLAISRGRSLTLKGVGELGEVIIESEEGIYLLGSTSLSCDNIAFDTNLALDKSSLFHLHKDAKLTLNNCVLRSDGAGVVARDACILTISNSKFSCRDSGVRLHNEMQREPDFSGEIPENQKVRCQIIKTDFFQCGSALSTFGSGFDVHVNECRVHKSEQHALSLASEMSKISIKKSAFVNSGKCAILIKGNSSSLRFNSSDNIFKDAAQEKREGNIYMQG